MAKKTQIVDVPAAERNGTVLRRFVRRLETVVAPRAVDASAAQTIGDRVIRYGIGLSVVGVLLQTFLHMTDFVVFDRGVDSFDADEDFGAPAWGSIAATFGASIGALLVSIVRGQRFFLLLAGVFAFLSFDDFMRVHERLGEVGTVVGIGTELELGRIIWPLLFMPVLVASAVLLWLAAKQFTGRASQLVRGGLVLLVLAVALEAASAALFQVEYGHGTWPYEIEVVLEEGAELAGWIWIATALTAVACSTLVRTGHRR
jgi:hypothetical protein